MKGVSSSFYLFNSNSNYITTYLNLLIAKYLINTTISECGTGIDDDFRQMESCGYYMEGVALAILGVFAILTNIFTLYIFLR